MKRKKKTRQQKITSGSITTGDSVYARKVRSGNNMYSHLFKKRIG